MLVHSSRRLTENQWNCFDLHQCIFVQFSSYAHERQDKMIQHVQTTDMHMAHWHVCMAIVLPGISEWKSTYNSWRYGCLEILDLKGLKPEGAIFVSPICASETRKLAVHWRNRGWSQISQFSSLQNLFVQGTHATSRELHWCKFFSLVLRPSTRAAALKAP